MHRAAPGKSLFLSTLSLRRATAKTSLKNVAGQISIHALLAESDFWPQAVSYNCSKFLSTLSLRRATLITMLFLTLPCNFYPRSPCGERRKQGRHYIGCKIFLSTLSLRRATPTHLLRPHFLRISIHALLAESDTTHKSGVCPTYISIHALLAESDAETAKTSIGDIQFLSTLSLRRATRGGVICYLDNIISIHALLAESDKAIRKRQIIPIISIHALLAESDSIQTLILLMERLFLSTLSLRRATQKLKISSRHAQNFYPRSPCGERRQT